MKKKIYNTCSTAGDMSPVPQIEGTKIEINTIMIEEKKNTNGNFHSRNCVFVQNKDLASSFMLGWDFNIKSTEHVLILMAASSHFQFTPHFIS